MIPHEQPQSLGGRLHHRTVQGSAVLISCTINYDVYSAGFSPRGRDLGVIGRVPAS